MSEQHPFLAAVWMTGAIVSFTLMAVAGRYTAAELDTFELMMYRSFIGLFLVLIAGAIAGTLREINGQRLQLHFVRNVFHFTGQNLWFFAVTVIPLAQLIALEFTTPIWVILLAPLFLAERLTPTRAAVAFIGFVGVMIVARPDFQMLNVGILAGATCAIGFAGAMIFTKLLTRTATVTCILFWLVAFQSIFGVLTAGWDSDVVWPSAAVWPWVAIVAICGLVAHFSITKALTLAPATIVGPMDFVRLPVLAAVGYWLFSEALDIWVFFGATLIVGANFANLSAESRNKVSVRDAS